MRTLNPSLALASLVGFLAAASCTLITDVDRTKIPTDAGAQAGETGAGGSTGGSSTGGSAGQAGGGEEAGSGGTGGGTGGTSGTGGGGGSTGATGGTSATGGSGGAPSEVCDKARGTITIDPITYFADGDTITIGDGLHNPVTFEFDLATAPGVTSPHVAIHFDGTEDEQGLALLLTNAINTQDSANKLDVSATTDTGVSDGAGGAGGQGGQGSVSNAGNGQGGAPARSTAVINLINDRAGARGNVKIKDTAGNPNFHVAGMSGGNAVVCSTATVCDSDDECASGDCTSHECR
jgi:hypothetical protein